ncbi:eukaryotic translation initiation factor 3 subunit K-like isoform X1 [Pyrus x bretschneideri]|uniref:eukaryotic translation initiation factor 3 subunit K-like isoform X1 n=1 Tax=Pyrus x bretschneideri TaxID=225117 RepID=UPI00202FB191|nr:eukaryotic translation initiation factor 3 subunit K-like isoform X1 [Pyrus x bretschneideri]XP_048436677.1 eukaryotic translation initiation factor 3 subunit K-like isoform X2 [Pyrus x bretschneideri]XP_048436678.1 eukaryotic translation initiation factor 3 subunit K-like isoform X3 [Pyrus x bretschneideri]XP_048436679.1 eukaryotic translation initiation factor 3 subunit K-like isoform X1 [Pyrus x bretschneideri]XP_048436681.1 eukaryotic translation initiation factor 3 subunit K-like isofor
MDAGKLAGESTQIVSRILVKALMAMLSPDFSLCLCLIPERVTFIVLDKQLVVGEFSHGEPHGEATGKRPHENFSYGSYEGVGEDEQSCCQI